MIRVCLTCGSESFRLGPRHLPATAHVEDLVRALHEFKQQLELFHGHKNFFVVDPQFEAALIHAVQKCTVLPANRNPGYS